MTELLAANQTVIHFIYGLALFLMGWTIWFQPRGPSGLRLAGSLPYLAAFGILRGLAEWGHAFVPIQEPFLTLTSFNLLHRFVEMLTAGSFLSLFLFGCDLVRHASPRFARLPSLAFGLFGIWMIKFLFFSTIELRGPNQAMWLSESEVWARYLLVVPGTLLAAVGLRAQTRQFRDEGFGRMVPDLHNASIGMAAYCILAGILVPKADLGPARWINMEMFPQMPLVVVFLRAACSTVVAFFLVRVLRVFDTEMRRRIEEAEVARASAEERERLRLELHDGILQSVYATGLGLQAARKRILTDPQSALQRVDLTLERLNRVIDEIRAYVRRLGSPPEPTRTLYLSITQAVDEFQTLYGIPVTLSTNLPSEAGLTTASAQQLVPILQEALSNAGRHSGARRVAVQVSCTEGRITLVIADNGRGFNTSAALELEGHYGLRNLSSRAQRAGGALEIRSEPGTGTVVEVILPLQMGEVAS